MPTPLKDAGVVLFDTSVVINLERHGNLGVVQAFLAHVGSRLAVARDVSYELHRNGADRFPALKWVLSMSALKHARVCDIPPNLLSDATRALRMVQETDDHEDRHTGEIATVFCGLGFIQAGQSVRLCMDDVPGLAWAYRYKVPCLRTSGVAAELVAHGLDPRLGYRIFKATEKGDRASQASFDAAVVRMKHLA